MTTRPEETDKKVVRDGEVVRVPLTLMDALQRSVQAAHLHDGMGNAAGTKPGFVFVTAGDETHSRAAYDGYVTYIGGAWRDTPEAEPETTNDAYADYVARLGDAWRSP